MVNQENWDLTVFNGYGVEAIGTADAAACLHVQLPQRPQSQ